MQNVRFADLLVLTTLGRKVLVQIAAINVHILIPTVFAQFVNILLLII